MDEPPPYRFVECLFTPMLYDNSVGLERHEIMSLMEHWDECTFFYFPSLGDTWGIPYNHHFLLYRYKEPHNTLQGNLSEQEWEAFVDELVASLPGQGGHTHDYFLRNLHLNDVGAMMDLCEKLKKYPRIRPPSTEIRREIPHTMVEPLEKRGRKALSKRDADIVEYYHEHSIQHSIRP